MDEKGGFCNFSRKSHLCHAKDIFIYSKYDRCFTIPHIKSMLNNPLSHSHWSWSRSHPFEAMRSLCHLVFLVFFASLHPSLGVTLLGKCCTSPVAGPGFELWEGNVVGRGFKSFDNYPKFCIGFKIRKSRCVQLLLSGSGTQNDFRVQHCKVWCGTG